MRKENCILYVGTFEESGSSGIYSLCLERNSGRLEPVGVSTELVNPCYLTADRTRRFLYAAGSIMSGDIMINVIASYRIKDDMGKLEFIDMQDIKGKAPCHISVDSINRHVFAANYVEGKVSAFNIDGSGRIKGLSCEIRHSGAGLGPDKQRQDKPHAHYISQMPGQDLVLTADLGKDEIVVYEFDSEKGLLKCSDKSLKIRPGSGPRHIAFDPDGRFAYVINELSSDIAVLEYNRNAFRKVQYISALPEGFKGSSLSSAIHLSPDANYLYASNRGHDSIACFNRNSRNGTLEPAGHTHTEGSYPRDFCIEPSGRFLLAANQNSGSIISFRRDPETGGIAPTGHRIKVPGSVCTKCIVQDRA